MGSAPRCPSAARPPLAYRHPAPSACGGYTAPPQYEYNTTPGSGNMINSLLNTSNQYVRVKSRCGGGAPTPLPVHLRSLIDTTSEPRRGGGRKTSAGMRQLGLVRNSYRLKEDDNSAEKYLFANQMLGYIHLYSINVNTTLNMVKVILGGLVNQIII